MHFFTLYLQITDPEVIKEYKDVDPEIITDDLQYGTLLEVCTLAQPPLRFLDQRSAAEAPKATLKLQLTVQLPDLDEDEDGNEYLADDVFKELRFYPFWVKCAKYAP